MGYMIVFGPCLRCKGQFGYNPNHVPSFRVHGKREPLCRSCIDHVNEKRREIGRPVFEVHPEAYEPADCP